jgi:hypothetical protein
MDAEAWAARGEEWYSSFRGVSSNKEDDRPAFVWVIYSLLERFLRVGPVGEVSYEDYKNRDVIVYNLEIDV